MNPFVYEIMKTSVYQTCPICGQDHNPVTTTCQLIPVLPSIPEPRQFIGIGGAPTRASILPTTGAERKMFPVASGVLDYFPDALAAIANVSYLGNKQHNEGKPLHWDRSKSGDEADTMLRHFLQRGSKDTDGIRHSAKMAWRALALLQKEIEAELKSSADDDIPF